MAKRTNQSSGNIDLTQFKYYYQFLFTNRLNWTKHSIPVVAYDPSSKFYIEGYIETVKNIKEEELFSTTEVIFSPAFFPTTSDSQISTTAANIYPSQRDISEFEGDKLKDSSISTKEIRINFPIPKKRILSQDIEKEVTRLLRSYNTPFTLNEICSYLDIKQKDLDGIKDTFLIQKSKRNDIISHKFEDTYFIDFAKVSTVSYTIPDLIASYRTCNECLLGLSREARGKSIVPGRGTNNRRLVVIGEAPGVQEEIEGVAFNPKAPAGKTLFEFMLKAGIRQEDIWLTNSVLCRPEAKEGAGVQNGKPSTVCIKTCNTRLKNELAILKPKVVVLLGSYSYFAYFGKHAPGVLANTGWVANANDPKVFFMPHPSYIARQRTMLKGEHLDQLDTDYLNNWKQINDAI